MDFSNNSKNPWYAPQLKIPSVSRITLDRELKKVFKRLSPGTVLDVGSKHSPYKKYIPCKKYLRLDINEKSNPDICCDLHDIKYKSNFLDTVIATEVLEHLYDPQKAVNEIYRVLKLNGVCILSTRFIQHYHPDPKDYYRFTQDSLNYLFKNFKKVEIIPHGNRLQSSWQILNIGLIKLVLNFFNPLIALVKVKKTRCPCGFIVYAVK